MIGRVLRANPGQSLTLEEMRRSLPSIFAPEQHVSRSDRYVYISTEETLDRLMTGGFLPVEARTTRPKEASRIGYAKHMLRFRGAEDLAKPDNAFGNSGVAYEVILRNAHDGTGSYGLIAGLIRFACENGLVISDGTVEAIKVLHAGNRRVTLDRVLASVANVAEQGPRVAGKIRRWRELEMAPEEWTAFADAAHKVRFADARGQITTRIKPEQLIVPRRPADSGRSLWDVLNVTQENAVRGGLSADGFDTAGRLRRFTTREVRGIDDNLILNRRLWGLAEQAARIKESGKRALVLEAA